MELQDIISSGLLELYAAGLTSPTETEQVENWVKQYPEVAAELNAIQSGIENYAQSNAITPAGNIKDKIFAAINTTPQINTVANTVVITDMAKVVGISSGWKWAAAASIALLIGSAAMNMVYYNKYDTASKSLQQTQQQLAEIATHDTEMKGEIDWVKNPNSMPVSLKETGTKPGTTAKIFWMKNTTEVMVDASNLPDAPAGMQYQFWAIVDGKPVDGGLIITNDKGKKFRMQKMKSFGRAEAFAISLEKEGGSATPTEVVSVGKII
ncbi:anti-sigma factor [Ferruginibacter sp. SUN106]|uniref:anti-sigma factor n=1 Tax=Ferruginibacter sp. SUN106 TaxID=2978348 RepID=UPI003D36E159